jgi:eukaryotic-like serine/threonine-protein kinase
MNEAPIPWQEALRYVRHVALALENVAAHNIVHRDIKPANILIGNDGVAKLADLGLAKQVSDEESSMDLTMQGVAIGSPSYMAPEQIRNAREARAPADIYSLGATLYHLLRGEPPYTGRTSAEVLAKVLRENPKPISECVPTLPGRIANLIGRMMAKDVKNRPQSARELLAELDALDAVPATTRSQRHRSHHAERDIGSLVMIGLVVALVLGLGGVLVWLKTH